MRRLSWGHVEVGDAGAVFQAAFGTAVFAQLALDAADRQLQLASPANAAAAAAVALIGATIATVIWWVGRATWGAAGGSRPVRVPRPWWRRLVRPQAVSTGPPAAAPQAENAESSSDATPRMGGY